MLLFFSYPKIFFILN